MQFLDSIVVWSMGLVFIRVHDYFCSLIDFIARDSEMPKSCSTCLLLPLEILREQSKKGIIHKNQATTLLIVVPSLEPKCNTLIKVTVGPGTPCSTFPY